MKFEYLTEEVRGEVDDTLNKRVVEGWELVQVIKRGGDSFLYMKRLSNKSPAVVKK